MTENKEMLDVTEDKSWDEALENESWIAPLVDIYETDDEYMLIANMPGVTKDKIKIKLEDRSIVIIGRVNYYESLSRKYTIKEIETGNYYRRFKISDSIDEGKIDVKLENGQLLAKLPKHERVKPRTIDIK